MKSIVKKMKLAIKSIRSISSKPRDELYITNIYNINDNDTGFTSSICFCLSSSLDDDIFKYLYRLI